MHALPGFNWSSKPTIGRNLDTGNELCEGLAGYWLLNEGQGLTAFDIAGGHNGTINGTTPWGQSALSFDGSTSYVSTGSPGINITGPYTAECMVMFLSTPSSGNLQTFMANGWNSTASTSQFQFELFNNSGLLGLYGGSTVAGTFMGADIAVSGIVTKKWYHFALSYTKSNCFLVQNGVVVATGSPGTYPAADTQPTYLGQQGGGLGRFFNGYMQWASIYNGRALNLSEIISLYKRPFQRILPPNSRRLYSFSTTKQRRTTATFGTRTGSRSAAA